MAKAGQNLAPDYNFSKTKLAEAWGPMAENHAYVDGEYIAKPYTYAEYPKMKYHPDYVHDQKPGINYRFTECAQLVNSPEEEKVLGLEWKDTPGELGIITHPDEKAVALKRLEEAKKGASWRKGANLPDEQVTEMHLEFARANGVPNMEHMGDLYKFLAGLTAAQFRDFLNEAAEWSKPEQKPTGKQKKEVAVV